MAKWNMYAAYATLLVVNKIFVNASHDIEVLLKDSVSIDCSPPVPMDIQWHHTGHMKRREYAYAGRKFYSSYNGRFQIDNYSLLIPSVNLDDAGLYECSEEKSGGQILNSVHLTVLESIPVCGSNMKSHGYVGPSTCNLEQENMTFTCAVSYSGRPPQMIWTTLNDSQAFNESTCKTENGRVNCSLILKADPKYDGSIFTCQSTKSSANCSTEIIKIQYFESELKLVEQNISDKVNCSVKSNQVLHFKWTQLHGNQYVTLLKSQTLLIQSPGFYRCIVEYRIRNAKCFSFGAEVFVPNPSISRSETWQTWMTAMVVVLSLICRDIIAIPLRPVYGFCVKKLKGKTWQNVGWPWQLPHVRAINRNYDVLQRCTDNNFYVTGCLRGEEVLDLRQESQLNRERDLQTRVRLLYDWLKEIQEDSKYQKFLQVMESDDVRQQHVAILLRGNIQGNLGPLGEARYTRLVKIRPKFATIFSGCRPNEGVELLFSNLRDLKAISATDYNEIVQQKDGCKRGFMLVSAIMRRSDGAFDVLRQTLTARGFGVLADYLVEGEMPIIHLHSPRPDREPELAPLLTNGVNHHLNGIDLAAVHAHHGKSIEVFIYCRKLENLETFIEVFNSGKLENIFSFTLGQLLQEIEPENTDGLEVKISIDEEEVFMLEEASGIEDWIQAETKIRKPGLKSVSNFGVQCDLKDFQMQEREDDITKKTKNLRQMENLPLEMLDMILLKSVRRMMVINSSEAFKSFDELMYQVLNHLRAISLLWDNRLHATEWVKIQLRRLRDTSKETADNTKKGILDCYANFVTYVDLSTKSTSLILAKDAAREKFSDTFVKGSNNEGRCRAFLDHLFTEGHPLAFLALRQVLKQNKADILDYVDGRKTFTMPEDDSLFLSNDEIKEIVSREDIYDQLMADMDPDRLGDWLKQERIITIKEWQENIAPLVNIKDRRRSVLEYLSTVSHPRAYIILRQVLIQDNPKIASAIDNATSEAEKKYDTLNQIMKHREFLMERMDSEFGLLHSLRANGSLTNDEFEEIETETTSRRLNGRLLDCISMNRSRNTADLLIEALKETDQGHLVNYMISDGVYDSKFADEWPLTETDIRFIDSNHEALVDLLDIDALLKMLYASDVINKRQREFISLKPTSRKKNEGFLKMLRKTSLRNYKETIICLRNSKQNHIAEILEKGEDVNIQKMKNQREKLVELIESQYGLLIKLLKMQAITRNQLEQIQREPTRVKINQMMLDYIFRENKHEDLITALSESSQSHVVNWIKSGGEYSEEFGFDWPLTESQYEILDANLDEFIDIIDNCELISMLYSEQVINHRQRDALRSKTTDHEKNETLLGMVRRMSQRSFQILINCLRKSNQGHVADILKNGGVIVPVHATMETDNLYETEEQIVDEMANLLLQRNTSPERANRLLAATQLKIIAVKRGQ